MSISINRDAAARFGIQPQVIDDTLNDAFGQRQVAQYFTQTNSYFVVLEVLPEMQQDIRTLERIYLKAADGSPVPLSTLVNIDTDKTGALSVSHQSQFPAVTLSFNLPQGVALGQAVDAIRAAESADRQAGLADRQLPGQRAGVPRFARQPAAADPRRAGRRLRDPRRAVRELRAPDHDPLDLALGRRRRAARALRSAGSISR